MTLALGITFARVMCNLATWKSWAIKIIYSVRSARLRSSVPLLEPGTPRFFGGMQKRINHSRVATNTRPTECPTQPRRMIDASRVYTFILTTKCIQNWASFRAISCAKNRTRADSTSLNTSDSNSIRSSARTGDTCSLLNTRC